ncbi:MAG: zf-HC2 domain-containing protein [Chloroflexota bacterium]|nr:zf-HC2 domain-containing protein [Chloroflexota bacterium]
MRCLDVRAKLQVYVDGELSLEQAALLERHLAGCEDCRAEMTRLQAVMAALETWPLVVEPADLTTRVMAQVRARPVAGDVEPVTLPRFRLRWSDFAISLGGAGLVFVVMLGWRYLASSDVARLYCLQMYLHLEMLQLEALLMIRRLVQPGVVIWGPLLGGVVLVITLVIALWSLAGRERGGIST